MGLKNTKVIVITKKTNLHAILTRSNIQIESVKTHKYLSTWFTGTTEQTSEIRQNRKSEKSVH